MPLSEREPRVRLTSVDELDAAHLVLHDIDLTECRFAGAVHLDQLRVDGWCTFATTLTGARWHGPLPAWWSARSTLAEEQVRKSLEDGKNEPDAADSYYGEMEMRRHDVTRPGGERVLLAACFQAD
ncbi:hypothetical protein CLM62_02975 [Streptomyces sp. SA15]|nr:hypothetical protein CLM62_02975 [Streptomyces sp. SA15]